MKTSIGFLLAIAILGGIGMAVLQHNAIARTRAEHQALVSDGEEARRLAEQNKDIARLRAESSEAEKLREQNKDLPSLRNEVRQLRRQAGDLAKLRTENGNLQARLQSGSQPNVTSMPPDFIGRAALFDAGQSTPEATVRTFFWAASQGNIQRAAACTLAGADNSRALSDADREQEQKRMANEFKDFAGFRIAEKQEISPDEVELKLQSSAGGEAMPMKLKRTDAGWKMEDH